MKILLLSLLLLPLAVFAHEDHDHGDPAEAAEAYPLETCVISGAKLDSMGGPYIHQHEGTEVRFCCRGCLPRFNRDPAKYLKLIEDASEEAPKPSQD
ncbi:MAG: hypothetical protein JJU05_00840 [Verrucomicrobia bacterium]|nr:hypothetical protein [Verrucomicrobiota bacterium]MCH8525970.1 hypothetical protein [Kiritimatiellia bacterium]